MKWCVGGTNGRAMAFCLGRPGLNPVKNLDFFSSKLSLGVGFFLITCNRKVRTLPSILCFLSSFTAVKFYQW